MNLSLSDIGVDKPCLGSLIRVDRGEKKLVTLLRDISRLLDVDGAELAWRSRLSHRSVLYAAWYDQTRNLSPPHSDDEGVARTMAHHLDVASRRQWTLSFSRCQESVPFSPKERASAQVAANLFGTAFKVWRIAEAKTRRVSALENLLETLDCGICVINARGRVIFSNSKSNEVLKRGGLLVRAGRLTAQGFTNTVRLQSAVHYALQSVKPKHRVDMNSVISIDRDAACPLALATFPLTPSSSSAEALIAVLILDPLGELSCAADITCRAQGLTQTEIRLVRHLVLGTSLIDACALMKIKPQTGRTYLRQIFSKFGISRQVDLVRCVLNSTLPVRICSSFTAA